MLETHEQRSRDFALDGSRDALQGEFQLLRTAEPENMAGMNRRAFAMAAVASSVSVVTGCDTDQKPAHTATLLNNSGVQEALKSVEDAIGTLEGGVGEFEGGENWRDVVPNVQAAAADVRDAFERLRNELGAVNS